MTTAPSASKLVYLFGGGKADGTADMRNLLGGKGAGLAEMTRLGIPVPPGFTDHHRGLHRLLRQRPQVPRRARGRRCATAWRTSKTCSARKFGDPANPLLVSVRSGARVSMPGMMDTVLNLGLNDAAVEGLARESGNERFAYD